MVKGHQPQKLTTHAHGQGDHLRVSFPRHKAEAYQYPCIAYPVCVCEFIVVCWQNNLPLLHNMNKTMLFVKKKSGLP